MLQLFMTVTMTINAEITQYFMLSNIGYLLLSIKKARNIHIYK